MARSKPGAAGPAMGDGNRAGGNARRPARVAGTVLALLAALAFSSGGANALPGSVLDNPAVHRAALVQQLTFSSDAPIPGHAEGRLHVSFSALGRQFDVELEPNHVLAPQYHTEWVGNGMPDSEPQISIYKGRLDDDLHSWARIAVRDGGAIEGTIATREEIYFFQAEQADAGQPATTMAYRLSDTEALPVTCAADSSAGTESDSGAPAGAMLAPLTANLATSATEQATLALVADYAYFTAHGANAAADMQSIINQVDGIFQAQIGVALQVTSSIVYTTSDPFPSTTDALSLLQAFSSYKADPGSPVYGADLAHLFTGRALNGGTVGTAWVGTLCNQQYGTALSEDYTTDNKSLILLAAHEIGHNFGAPHDAQSGSACAATPASFIMNPVISDALALEFSDCSKSQVAPVVSGATCLSLPPTPPPTPSPTPQPAVNLAPAVARPGGIACVATTLAGSAGEVMGTTNNIGFDPTLFTPSGCRVRPALAADGNTLISSSIQPGTEQVELSGASTAVPDGTLYVCEFSVAAAARVGTYPLANAAAAVDAFGSAMTDVTGAPGQITVTTCTADCNGDGHVTIGEVVNCVNLFLGQPLCNLNMPELSCPVADANLDGIVSIGEVTACINAFLGAC